MLRAEVDAGFEVEAVDVAENQVLGCVRVRLPVPTRANVGVAKPGRKRSGWKVTPRWPRVRSDPDDYPALRKALQRLEGKLADDRLLDRDRGCRGGRRLRRRRKKTGRGRVPPLCRREPELRARRHTFAATHSRGTSAAASENHGENDDDQSPRDAHLARQHQDAVRGKPPNCAAIRDAPTILRGFGRTNTHWFAVGQVTSSQRPFGAHTS